MAHRLLAYGTATDIHDEDIRMIESTGHEAFKEYTETVSRVFGPEYLRTPNDADVVPSLGNECGTVSLILLAVYFPTSRLSLVLATAFCKTF